MIVIVGGRQTGKTTKLIAWLKAAPEGEARVAIFHSNEEAMAQLRANRNGLNDLESWQFGSLDDLDTGAFSAVSGHIVIGIDNLDLILGRLLRTRWPVDFVTMTGELE